MAIIRIPIPTGVPGSVDVDIPRQDGDPDTQAYFDSLGALADDADATMSPTDWQLADSGGFNAAHVDRVARSTALGADSVATGDDSLASGLGAEASRVGQRAHSSGPGGSALDLEAAPGGTQESALTMAGETPGVGVGETVELKLGPAPGGPFLFQTEKACAITVTGIVKGIIGGVNNSRAFKQMIVVKKEGTGSAVITGSGAQESIGTAGAATWTLAATIGVGPNRLVVTLGAGATTAQMRATVKLEVVEISLPGEP